MCLQNCLSVHFSPPVGGGSPFLQAWGNHCSPVLSFTPLLRNLFSGTSLSGTLVSLGSWWESKQSKTNTKTESNCGLTWSEKKVYWKRTESTRRLEKRLINCQETKGNCSVESTVLKFSRMVLPLVLSLPPVLQVSMNNLWAPLLFCITHSRFGVGKSIQLANPRLTPIVPAAEGQRARLFLSMVEQSTIDI